MGLFKKQREREEDVKYSISLCLAILHEYDLAFGATINDSKDPMPVIVDLKNGSVYALHDKIINENIGKEESGEKEKPI